MLNKPQLLELCVCVLCSETGLFTMFPYRFDINMFLELLYSISLIHNQSTTECEVTCSVPSDNYLMKLQTTGRAVNRKQQLGAKPNESNDQKPPGHELLLTWN